MAFFQQISNQIFDFDENSAFPIVADPTFWQITKCAASVAWMVGSSVFAVTKLAKIKKYIKALGGISEAVPALIGATSFDEKNTAFWTTVMNLASAILGVDAIIDNCPGIKSQYKKLKSKLGL